MVMQAEELYRQGNEHRRRGDYAAAMNCYLEAVERDPESPAATALEMLEGIMDFYCRDYYNP